MISLFISFATSILNYSPIEEKSFINWMRETNQFYTGDEYRIRFGIWQSNRRYIKEHNKKSSFQLSLNRFAALTPAEYSSTLSFQRKQIRSTSNKKTQNRNYPASVDWRDTAVTPIRDGSSATVVGVYAGLEAIEGSYVANQKQKLQTFSLQELIDCCDVGDPFEYLLGHDGSMMLDNDYPLVGSRSECKRDDTKAAGHFTDYVIVEDGEEDLADKVAINGPIRSFIDASHASFMLYSSGIYDEPSCNPDNTNFDVAVVGYGSDGNTKYWILKNHWGQSWGEEGFMRMIWDNNQCGVATLAFSVI